MKTTRTTKQVKQAVKAVNDVLTEMGSYFTGLPLAYMFDALRTNGFQVTEDNLLGVYCGAEGRVHEHVGDGVYFTMTWYKMETGRYEVVAYVS